MPFMLHLMLYEWAKFLRGAWEYSQNGGNLVGHYVEKAKKVAAVLQRFVDAAGKEEQPLGDAFIKEWEMGIFKAYMAQWDQEYHIKQYFNEETGKLKDEEA